MRPRVIYWAPSASSANNICLVQTPSGAGALTLNGAAVSGGTATLTNGDVTDRTAGGCNQRRVLLTTTADETGKTFIIAGTKLVDGAVKVITETLTGVNNTSTNSFLDYATVTSITVSAALAGSITVGTGVAAGGPSGNRAIASTAWLRPELDAPCPFAIGLAVTLVSGTGTFDVEHTFDVLLPISTAPAVPFEFLHSSISAKTASTDGNYAFPITGLRLRMTASSSGILAFQAIQAGVMGGPGGALWG